MGFLALYFQIQKFDSLNLPKFLFQRKINLLTFWSSSLHLTQYFLSSALLSVFTGTFVAKYQSQYPNSQCLSKFNVCHGEEHGPLMTAALRPPLNFSALSARHTIFMQFLKTPLLSEGSKPYFYQYFNCIRS